MKAAVCTRYGPPEVVQTAEVDKPEPSENELLVRIEATTVALVERLGADRVIDYRAADFTEDTQTYDVVFDAAGKSSFGRCKRLLKPKGIYLSTELGPFPQNPILGLVTPVLGGKKVLFPIPKHDQQTARYVKGLIASGAFKPLIDRRYSLSEIVDAYRYAETGQKIGNIVINVAATADQPE